MVLQIHGLHLQSGIRYCLANLVNALVFQSGPSLLTVCCLWLWHLLLPSPPLCFLSQRKRKHQMGNSPPLPTAKLTNWCAATHILFFFLQSQCNKYPSSYSRLVPLVVLCVLPLLTLEGLCSIYFPFLLCLQHLPLYCFLLSVFKHIQVSSYYSFFPLWLEGTF